MDRYVIKVERLDMAPGNVQTYAKWANDHKQALKYIFKNRTADGYGTFKRGGTGKILSVKKIKE